MRREELELASDEAPTAREYQIQHHLNERLDLAALELAMWRMDDREWNTASPAS
jgi:hypothetical protein